MSRYKVKGSIQENLEILRHDGYFVKQVNIYASSYLPLTMLPHTCSGLTSENS